MPISAGASRIRPTRPRPAPRWRGRTLLALASAVVFTLTGYAWMTLGKLDLSTSDVTTGSGPDGALDILLVGTDSRTDVQGNPLPEDVLARLRAGDNEANLTDTLILLHIPNDHSRAVAYSLPRDSYVSIPDGHGRHKINSAFTRAKAKATTDLQARGVTSPAELDRRSSDVARKLLVRTVEGLTGAGIDHYAEVNLLGFDQVTQAVGGVEVCLNAPVHDSYSGARFPAGRQTISGPDALAFVRQRHGLPRGDLDRVVRQQAFLAGLARSMLSTGVLASPAKLNGMFDALERSVVLDQGWDMLAFAQQMQGMAGGAIRFETIPVQDPEYDTPDGLAIEIDPADVREAIRRGDQGLPPESPVPARPAGLEAVTVDVRNTTRIAGLAARVRKHLIDEHIPVGDTANAPEPRTSGVYYAPGQEDIARYVADHLGRLPVHRDNTLRPGAIRVWLAADYHGPGAQGFAPVPLVQLDGPRRPATSDPGANENTITAGGVSCVN